ncbi:putative dehydrogenase [Friedmanniella endophytica]|uniref:Putative dehydrogenase n=1 Tax=Microlunatus kandeliicorticis TaxID=1759536 RepID=A0A7W3P520_9ACTN|nr:Gfo/Idh/MocA family oxidoreductase [Microlunatus kandeliicorticis]MBA8793501.1 putative dehydrogenase [Microlunatus kandeliicorticis]
MTAVTPLRVGIVGLGWMGQVHARAHTRVRQHYPELPVCPVLVAVADNAPDDRLARAADLYGVATHTDWRELLSRDDLDLVSVTGPNFLHREVGVAVAESGRHLWIEKPAGRDAAETEAIAAAVRDAGVRSAAGFNYRNAPAVELARAWIAEGRIGAVEHVELSFLADYSADPSGPLSWRFRAAEAGSGVLGDLVSHGIDLGRHLVGELTEVVAETATFVPERPPAAGASTGHAHVAGDGPPLPVENEDYAAALLRFAGGVRGSLVASRVAVGEQCSYAITVHGSDGALRWDFRRMGELDVCLGGAGRQGHVDASWQTRLVRPGDAELARFQPGAGIAMSYDDLKVIEAHRLLTGIASGTDVGATIEDAARAARVVEAMVTSAAERRWVPVRTG